MRPYKHFRQKREDVGQFNVGGASAGHDADRRNAQNHS